MNAPILKNSRWKRKDKIRVDDKFALGNPYNRLAAHRLLTLQKLLFHERFVLAIGIRGTVTVPPVPAISMWGLGTATLVVLGVGSLVLLQRRRPHRVRAWLLHPRKPSAQPEGSGCALNTTLLNSQSIGRQHATNASHAAVAGVSVSAYSRVRDGTQAFPSDRHRIPCCLLEQVFRTRCDVAIPAAQGLIEQKTTATHLSWSFGLGNRVSANVSCCQRPIRGV